MSTVQEEKLSGIQSEISNLMDDLLEVVKRVQSVGIEVDEVYQTLPCQVAVAKGGGNKKTG